VHAKVFFEALEVAVQSSVQPMAAEKLFKTPVAPVASDAIRCTAWNFRGLVGRHFVGWSQREPTGSSSASGVFESLSMVCQAIERTPEGTNAQIVYLRQ
jgi:hypothetical protein